MPIRYKVRFPDNESYKEAAKLLGPAGTGSPHTKKILTLAATPESRKAPAVYLHVQNRKRRIMSFGASPLLKLADGRRHLDAHLELLSRRLGAEIVPDFQYSSGFEDINEPVPAKFMPARRASESSKKTQAAGLLKLTATADDQSPSLNDVLPLISAEEAWKESTGKGITIAVVDTGVSGKRPEFPAAKRVGQWQPIGDDAWTDTHGHGTMCACIALATKSDGGVYNGVAPDASLISCKTNFFDTELTAIYDYLTDLATKKKMNIITTNSFGWSGSTPPADDANSDFIPALNDAVAAGIKVVFAAGNDHQKVGGKPNACSPNSIWLSYKSRADVMVVASCTPALEMWFNSSRGPGQYFGKPDTSSKPDVTAPTLANGYVVYGDEIQSVLMWGTSGAGPQVAGLAALLLGKKPDLTRDELFNAIRSSAGSLASAYKPTCAGSGIIDCKKAIDSI
jgi:serine protease AprX